jgi:hypothetical protein
MKGLFVGAFVVWGLTVVGLIVVTVHFVSKYW